MKRAKKQRPQKKNQKSRREKKTTPTTNLPFEQPAPDIQQSLEIAVTHHIAGRRDVAEGIYRQILQIDPNQPATLHLLGLLAHQSGNHDAAVELVGKALAIAPNFAEAHATLAGTLHTLGRIEEAEVSYRKSLSLKPDQPEALRNFGNLLRESGKLEDAIDNFRKAVAINPNSDEYHFILGKALMDLDKKQQAWVHLRLAVALNPENFLSWTSLSVCLEGLTFSSVDDSLLHDLKRILEHPTIRPNNVFPPTFSAICSHSNYLKALKLMEDGASYEDIAETFSAISLFLQLLALCSFHGVEIERLLTSLRHSLLQNTIAGNTGEKGLGFSSALALQCFTNEYVYDETDEETQAVAGLQDDIAAMLEKNDDVPPSFIAALGSYRALYKFPWAGKLAKRDWTGPINDVIQRQILEPMEEIELRSDIPCLTPIQNEVSQSVRDQYEENPFPRWIKTSTRTIAHPIDVDLRSPGFDFDLGDYETPQNPEILIAGCGTGQHSIFVSSRFANSQVLAVDLSLASLAYAKRKTKEYGITNIDYAQADIVELGGLDRRFDLIESAGVLHHLGDPVAGWRVLVGLLKSGGLMRIGLYSDIARQDIVNARSLIAQKGYSASLKDMRQCRKDIIAMAEAGDAKMQTLCNSGDFFSSSECRDLIFHVQEYRFTVPQIQSALEELGLDFVGFELEDDVAVNKINKLSPDGNAKNSTALWHEFEIENPATFRSMYQFWCRKR